MAFNFTADQQAALDFPGNVIVSAGAGSGKTRVLVEKYFRLLVDEHPEWPVDSVVAITFTRKAAAELKARIIKRVLDELDVETETGSRRKRLRELRRNVGAAPIGTIHNFCGRLLREFSFDARLNPDFAIVEGAQEGALRMKAARETIAAATSDNGGELYKALLVLLNNVSVIRLNGLLTDMLANRTAYLRPAREYVGSSPGELFSRLKEFHAAFVGDLRRDLGRQWISLLQKLEQAAGPGIVHDVAGAAVSQWPNDPATQWSDCSEILGGVLDDLFTRTFTCRKAPFKKAGFEEGDPLWSACEEMAARYAATRLDDLDDGDMDDLVMSRHLALLFLKAVEVYENLRGGMADESEAQLLDYADLELYAEKLVANNVAIQRQIRERYRFLIIDEFQDTSESQWTILKPLATNDSGDIRPDALFVVGDKKQGVYGFRDANVSLFSMVQEFITTANEEISGGKGAVTMAANFRTAKEPLEFINRVFKRLLTSESNAWNVDFEPLTHMRHDKQGCVEFLLSGAGEPDTDDETDKVIPRTADERREDEANLVAVHVARLIENGDAEPGDIALLFRKRSVFSVFEEALRRRGIPVVTQQGFNLFHQPELADMVAALNTVVYPHKDMVLAHYLRSPFIGFTDDLLLKIARTPGRSFWDKLNRVAAQNKYFLDTDWHPLTEMETQRLTFALDVLHGARSLVGTAPPHAVVRFMMDRLGARTSVLAGKRGTQAVANLEKLLSVARSAEYLSYEEFLDYVESEGLSDRGIMEAADLTSIDAVKIMTIHASKGLEFPVVYLADLNSGTANTLQDVEGDGSHWMTLRMPKDLMPRPSFLMDYFRMLSRKQAEAEERRVFYVAMTRCEQRLILSANIDRRRGGNTFYSWIADEFESARGTDDLFTDEDFDMNANTLNQTTRDNRNRLPQREARIEAALRAANALYPDPASQGTNNVIKDWPLDSAHEILRVFLPLAWQSDDETALRLIDEYFAADWDDVEVRNTWHQRLTEISHWVRTSFAADTGVRFFAAIRIVNGKTVQVIEPHIVSESRCAWIILPGPAGTMARSTAQSYMNATREIIDAPRAIFWPPDSLVSAEGQLQ